MNHPFSTQPTRPSPTVYSSPEPSRPAHVPMFCPWPGGNTLGPIISQPITTRRRQSPAEGKTFHASMPIIRHLIFSPKADKTRGYCKSKHPKIKQFTICPRASPAGPPKDIPRSSPWVGHGSGTLSPPCPPVVHEGFPFAATGRP